MPDNRVQGIVGGFNANTNFQNYELAAEQQQIDQKNLLRKQSDEGVALALKSLQEAASRSSTAYFSELEEQGRQSIKDVHTRTAQDMWKSTQQMLEAGKQQGLYTDAEIANIKEQFRIGASLNNPAAESKLIAAGEAEGKLASQKALESQKQDAVQKQFLNSLDETVTQTKDGQFIDTQGNVITDVSKLNNLRNIPSAQTITTQEGIETIEAKELAKQRAKAMSKISTDASAKATASRRDMQAIDEGLAVIDEINTGTFELSKQVFAKALMAIGADIPESFNDPSKVEQFIGDTSQLVLGGMEAMKGSQSEADRKLVENRHARLGNTREGNILLLKSAKEIAFNNMLEDTIAQSALAGDGFKDWQGKNQKLNEIRRVWESPESGELSFFHDYYQKYARQGYTFDTIVNSWKEHTN